MSAIVQHNHHEMLQEALLRRGAEDTEIAGRAQNIISQVKSQGDTALRELTAQFDGHSATDFRLSSEQVSKAAADCSSAVKDALAFAAKRIRAFHEHTLPTDFSFTDEVGATMGYRYQAMSSAGVYVPGGLAAYPSSVLMNCLPALVAGVERLVLCTPTPNSYLNPAVMAAIDILELEEVYAIGGAQAIAAMAYGTETLKPVDFIAGPGNAYVAAAKREVFGAVGIDSLAGPSEVTVVADKGANPRHVAFDLLAQAEHDTLAQSICIADDAALLQQVEQEISLILQDLPRREIAEASWQQHGLMLLVGEMGDVPALVDKIAPEHLILSIAEPEVLFARIRHAGSVFMGYHTPEAIGDYLSGPNHVLPTSGSARFASGLSCGSFMKHTSFQHLDVRALQAISPEAMLLADAEGLDAHRLSMLSRVE